MGELQIQQLLLVQSVHLGKLRLDGRFLQTGKEHVLVGVDEEVSYRLSIFSFHYSPLEMYCMCNVLIGLNALMMFLTSALTVSAGDSSLLLLYV